jgi:hypothetical protein
MRVLPDTRQTHHEKHARRLTNERRDPPAITGVV